MESSFICSRASLRMSRKWEGLLRNVKSAKYKADSRCKSFIRGKWGLFLYTWSSTL
ncbi:unnamed protein product [Ectocarpus sp. CCAP 1310/34]|nr:unnamed protein product [Ectocarpus sp. CCAP 1310/34]